MVKTLSILSRQVMGASVSLCARRKTPTPTGHVAVNLPIVLHVSRAQTDF